MKNEGIKKKSLQKLPNSKELQPELEDIFQRILGGDEVIINRIRRYFSDEENRKVAERVFELAMTTLAKEDRDQFIELFQDHATEHSKNSLWEINHIRIVNAIDSLTLSYNRFPARCELVSETGFSRQTINKHLKQYFGSKEHQEKKEEYIVLREKLLSRLYRFAINGDVKAAKVFLSATEEMERSSLSIRNQQNNFIQINGLTITQEHMKRLSEEQQAKVVELLLTLGPIMKAS